VEEAIPFMAMEDVIVNKKKDVGVERKAGDEGKIPSTSGWARRGFGRQESEGTTECGSRKGVCDLPLNYFIHVGQPQPGLLPEVRDLTIASTVIWRRVVENYPNGLPSDAATVNRCLYATVEGL
jgi:hypothetical protein